MSVMRFHTKKEMLLLESVEQVCCNLSTILLQIKLATEENYNKCINFRRELTQAVVSQQKCFRIHWN